MLNLLLFRLLYKLPFIIIFIILFISSSYTEGEIIISSPELIYKEMDYPCDAVSATLKKDSSILYTILPSWDRTYIYEGTIEYPWQKKTLFLHKDFYKIFSEYAKKHTAEYEYDFGTKNYSEIKNGADKICLYLKNVYKVSSNELLGFIHVEYVFQDGKNPYPAYYSIALAYSNNNGRLWNFCGDIIRTFNISPDTRCNIGGAAYIIKDKYFYVFFNEVDAYFNKYPCVARAPVSLVIEEARHGRVVNWEKYAGNEKWEIVACSKKPGLGFRIIPDSILPNIDMHSDAAYCSALKMYLIAVNSNNNLYILQSKDGIKWEKPIQIASWDKATNRIPVYPYFASLGRDSNDDCSIVGKEFSIFFLNVLFEPISKDRLSLYRVNININNK